MMTIENYLRSECGFKKDMWVVLIFLTWLIFGGGDLSPGGPKFFGHDGG